MIQQKKFHGQNYDETRVTWGWALEVEAFRYLKDNVTLDWRAIARNGRLVDFQVASAGTASFGSFEFF